MSTRARTDRRSCRKITIGTRSTRGRPRAASWAIAVGRPLVGVGESVSTDGEVTITDGSLVVGLGGRPWGRDSIRGGDVVEVGAGEEIADAAEPGVCRA